MSEKKKKFEPTALQKAVLFFGNKTNLARAIGKNHMYVARAVKAGTVTAEVARDIEKASNGAITRKELRPDIFED